MELLLTGSKLGKEYDKAVYCHPVYLISMQSTSQEMPSWMNHKPESRLLREISTTSDKADDTTLMAKSEEELKRLLMRVKEQSEKAGLKLNIKKQKKKKKNTNLRSWHPVPLLHGKQKGEKWKQ